MKYLKLLVTVLVLVWLTGCKDVVDFYLGVPLQPAFDEDSFVPGLNIFGIIRPDATGVYNNSFIQFQKVIPAVGYTDSLDVGTVIVKVEKDNDGISPVDFLLTDHHGVFSEEVYRPDTPFSPKAGDIFMVECVYPELPVLCATTLVPNPPVLLLNTLTESNRSLSFEIQVDTTIHMIDIYVYAGGLPAGFRRLPGEQDANTSVLFTDLPGAVDSMDIYSYDENMALYYMTANTSLNFNKYRESFSTVENGYGVFGALNHARFYLR
ncbi:MAG: hypothetical protein JXR41_05670 [Bacteroidales bacterium]|nr:hypothetical protein [Bacteroidales bacterium]MBN2762557.1 hypothetical protein [Bacteroidales bacterium]